MEVTNKPIALDRGEGQGLWFLGASTFVLATAEQTGGAFGLIEHVLPAGFASPYHTHRIEDESFYVVEGEMTFICDGKALRATPGTFVFGPRGIPHGFRVEGTVPARLLLMPTPGGFEQFVVELSEPMTDPASPPTAPPDMGKLMAVAQKYQIDILGPLPL